MTEKKVHRFLLSALNQSDEHLTIADPKLCRQIHGILKLKPKELCIFFENNGPDVVVELTTVSAKEVSGTIVQIIKKQEQKTYVIAAIAITKGATFEFITQKLTELGVREIIPLISDRTVKQGIRHDRLQTISDEALEQSGGNTRVIIHEPTKLEVVITAFPYQRVVFHPGAPTNNDMHVSGKIVMYIGPEGGWSAADEALFKDHDTILQGLGTRILRTETAAIVGAYELLWHS